MSPDVIAAIGDQIYRFIGAGVGFFLGVTLLVMAWRDTWPLRLNLTWRRGMTVEEINEAIRSSIENAVPEEPGGA